MHLQNPVQDWPSALVQMPDWSLLKSVNDPGILLDGRNKWAAAGRDPEKLHTDFRFFNLQPAPLSDWESAKAWWRQMYFRFIDGTYLRNYAAIVDSVESCNEYFANSTWQDPQDAKRCIQSAQAACAVWSQEFRGRTVHSPDGGEGFIPDNCRVVVGNGPVTNTTPREYYQMVVDTDSILGMHPYTLWVNKKRAPDDWQNHSGLWLREEQQYGLKPRYLWSECGPYNGTSAGGWRISNCLNGDVALLVEAMRQWIRDVANTDAYAEGRIIGPGAFFTTGGGNAWEHYELLTPQLAAIAQMLQSEWKPGVDDNMDTVKIRQHAKAIVNIVDDVWWMRQPPVFKTAVPNKVITFRHADGTPIIPNPRPNPITYQLDVFFVNEMLELLMVTNFGGGKIEWWVFAADLNAAP